MDFKIEKNVPITDARGKTSKFPFKNMEKGDSFLVPAGTANINTARSAAFMAGKRFGAKFSCRKDPGGLRVWRTE